MEPCQPCGSVPLDKTLPVLAKSKQARELLIAEFGPKDATLLLDMMRSGRLSGDLGGRAHDFVTDAIRNDAEPVWSGIIHESDNAYEVSIFHFHGVYFVHACDWFDPIGYFLNLRNAVRCVDYTWENVEEKRGRRRKQRIVHAARA